jgi:hypothetical protein
MSSTITVRLNVVREAREAYTIKTGVIPSGEYILDYWAVSEPERSELVAAFGIAPSNNLSGSQYFGGVSHIFEASVVPNSLETWLIVARELLSAKAQWKKEDDAKTAEALAKRDADFIRNLEHCEALSDNKLLTEDMSKRRNGWKHAYYYDKLVVPDTLASNANIVMRVAIYNSRLKEVQAAYDTRQAAMDAEKEARIEADKLAAQAAKAKREADKLDWVKEHGSEHLKLAIENGYDCQCLYATERAELEYPDYQVDFKDNADWDPRSCPSEAALLESIRVKGEVVWLTSPVAKPSDEWVGYFEACEAVVVRGFLEKYHLIKEF